jgi:predicted metalloprotease
MMDAAALRLIGAGRGKRAAVGEALELQADCLTGAWAAAASKRLGPVPAPFWGQLVWSWRNAVEDLASQGVRMPAEFDPFASAAQGERQEAFRQGYAGGGIAACPPPAEIVARG